MRKQNALVQKACPSCRTKITLGKRSLAKKIRCPKCRVVVVISTDGSESVESVEPVAENAGNGVLSPPENSHEFWVDPIDHGAGFLDEKQRSTLLRHLSGRGEHHITISAPAHDPEALLFAHALRKVYRAAGWNITDLWTSPSQGPRNAMRKSHGALALYTGSWPFPDEVTKTCMALTAAGIEFSSHIDPCQTREKAILVVGRDIRRTVSDGRARRWRAGDPQPEPQPAEEAPHPIFEELGEPADESWLQRILEAASSRQDAPGSSHSKKTADLLSRGVRMAEAIAAELAGGGLPGHAKVDRFPALRELNCVLRGLLDPAIRAEDAALPQPLLVRRCARLAMAVLEEGPGEIDRGARPEGGFAPLVQSSSQRETLWVSALRFADAVFTQPPVSDDFVAQAEFEALLAEAFRQGEPSVQRIISSEVRAWHWFRTPGRRALHDELFYREARCEAVVASAFGRLQYWPHQERERVFRRALQRDDKSEELAEVLGHILGWESILVDEEGTRFPAADLAGEITETPDSFPFLGSGEIRREFLRHFVIGMTEGAKRVCGSGDRAEDFAAWCQRAWAGMDAEGRDDPRGVVLLVSHWLGKRHRKENADPEALRHWWQCLSRLLKDVVLGGGMNDISTLFFTLRDGAFLDLPTADEVLELVGAYLDRIRNGLEEDAETLPVGMHDVDEGGRSLCQEVAGCITDILVGLLDDGRLDRGQIDVASSFVLRLATEQAGSRRAVESLHRFETGEPRQESGLAGLSARNERAA